MLFSGSSLDKSGKLGLDDFFIFFSSRSEAPLEPMSEATMASGQRNQPGEEWAVLLETWKSEQVIFRIIDRNSLIVYYLSPPISTKSPPIHHQFTAK